MKLKNMIFTAIPLLAPNIPTSLALYACALSNFLTPRSTGISLNIYCLQHFGRQNYEYEVSRQNIGSNSDEDIWPLALMMADNVVMWQQAGKNNQPVK